MLVDFRSLPSYLQRDLCHHHLLVTEAKMLEVILGSCLSLPFSLQSTSKFCQLYLQDRSILKRVVSGRIEVLKMDGIRSGCSICHMLYVWGKRMKNFSSILHKDTVSRHHSYSLLLRLQGQFLHSCPRVLYFSRTPFFGVGVSDSSSQRSEMVVLVPFHLPQGRAQTVL